MALNSAGAIVMGVLNFMYSNGITLTVTATFVVVLVLDWISGRALQKKMAHMPVNMVSKLLVEQHLF